VRKRILVVMAHPDDIDFWGVGSVMLWLREGHHVTYLLVTSGDAGGFEAESHPGIGRRRQAEQAAAAKTAGVHDVRFLTGYRDGEVHVSTALLRDLTRVVRRIRPHRVLAQSPSRTWDDVRQSHPDHLAVGEAVAQVVYPFARNPFAFPELLEQEGLEAWSVQELYLQGDPAPNLWLDVAGTYPEREQALMAHASQHPDPAQARADLRAQLAKTAAAGGLPPGALAEAFRAVPLPP
jgi:LmbE family N-acetylglucosaminyl deacetylase